MILLAFVGLLTFGLTAFAAKRGLFGPGPGHHTKRWAHAHDITAFPPRFVDVRGERTDTRPTRRAA